MERERVMSTFDRREVAAAIDHTLLRAEATAHDIDRLCEEAIAQEFAAVCVMPAWVSRAAARLYRAADNRSLICTVVGFPLGAHLKKAKLYEAAHAIEEGAGEIDMVMNVGAFLSRKPEMVAEEIASMADLLDEDGLRLKVIIETALLDREEIVEACRIAVDSGADFVKTSTGFASRGATLEDVRLMRSVLPEEVAIKASGGIGTGEEALAMLAAGASRLGTSRSLAILDSLPHSPGSS